MKDIQNLVEQYLNGTLEPAQIKSFELRLQTDTELADELRLQKDMQSYLLNKEKKTAFKNKLQKLGDEYFDEEKFDLEETSPTTKKSNYRWLAIAASAAAAIAIVIYLLLPKENLYEQLAVHQPLQLTQKGSSPNDLLIKLEQHFNNKKYTDALAVANQLLITQPGNLENQVIKSICLIELNQEKEAQKILEPITEGQSAFRAEAQWYFAMSLIKTNQLELAKRSLEKINTTDSYWYNKAQLALKKL